MSRQMCPHGCGANLSHAHTRDTGDATELPEGACRILFERRGGVLPDSGDRRRVADIVETTTLRPLGVG